MGQVGESGSGVRLKFLFLNQRVEGFSSTLLGVVKNQRAGEGSASNMKGVVRL